jgi:hypothetical protein
MRYKALTAAGIVGCSLLVVWLRHASAQDVGEVKVYREQFADLHVKVQAISKRIIEDGDTKLSTSEEIIALEKVNHTLSEECLRQNVESQKKGRPENKTLLLIAEGSDALEFELNSLFDYASTNDRSFVGLARDGEDLTKSVEKVML